ncbi:hypothetical protein JDW19_21535 [Paenibacillus polymyxa]|uniref:Carrier domain-containing protein n=1 Tax=Paenibacillus polymyxa TaxID=1406 RepID=A0A8I1LW59_PAEPO|nr:MULTISPECIES: phosphopantetheine-binding protein [Paenibacillus]KAF6569871.1 hypothetical protein G9G53_21560 [Paenibacillus sp. EKM206P]KAF6585408.1 hypothetical protein G9G52_22690 [Paenibacillus sp. EKM205P]MBM0635693.1 hypothetical protein [Paenibacillus polymyxa]
MSVLTTISDYLRRELASDPGLDWDEHTNLLASGILDSLSIVRLIVFLEEEYQISLDNYLELKNFESVSAMAAVIERETREIK